MDPAVLQNYPFTTSAHSYHLDLTDADDSIVLAIGGYFVYLVSTEPLGCTLRIGTAAVTPTDDDATGVVGAILPPGVPMTLVVREADDLHAIMNASSAVGTLFITKVR